MSSFEIPSGLPDILREFTREVLRANTYETAACDTRQCIFQFAHQYFSKRCRQRRANRMNKKTVSSAITDLFRAADADNSGDLDITEIASLLRTLASDLGLTSSFQIEHMTRCVERSAMASSPHGKLVYEEVRTLRCSKERMKEILYPIETTLYV